MTNKKIDNSILVLETLDKLNLLKADMTFLSNLLIAWNIEQFTPAYDDMHGMSRICINVNEQLIQCTEILELLRENKV